MITHFETFTSSHDVVNRYGISVSQMTTDMYIAFSALVRSFPVHDLSQNMT